MTWKNTDAILLTEKPRNYMYSVMLSLYIYVYIRACTHIYKDVYISLMKCANLLQLIVLNGNITGNFYFLHYTFLYFINFPQ